MTQANHSPESRNEISLDTTIRKTSQQASCDLQGEVIVLGMKKGEYFGLNEIGSSVWSRLEKPHTIRTLRDALLSEYDVDSATCERDLLGLVAELRNLELVEVVDEAAV